MFVGDNMLITSLDNKKIKRYVLLKERRNLNKEYYIYLWGIRLLSIPQRGYFDNTGVMTMGLTSIAMAL